jgi:hypothetical protein
MKRPGTTSDIFSDLSNLSMPLAPRPMQALKPIQNPLDMFKSTRNPNIAGVSRPRYLPASVKTVGGPIPVDWLAAAAKQGKDALLVGLMVWCARNWPKFVGAIGHIILTNDVFNIWGVARPGRALSRLEASGLIKVVGRPEEYAIAVEPLMPGAPYSHYILGPIDVAWAIRAAKFGVTALLVGLAVWGCYRQRRNRRNDERNAVPNVALVNWSISPDTKCRVLHKLEGAGLIEVERRGKHSPRVTIVSPYVKDKRKGESAAKGDVIVGASHKLDMFKSTQHSVAIAAGNDGVNSAAIIGNVVPFATASSAANQ